MKQFKRTSLPRTITCFVITKQSYKLLKILIIFFLYKNKTSGDTYAYIQTGTMII